MEHEASAGAMRHPPQSFTSHRFCFLHHDNLSCFIALRKPIGVCAPASNLSSFLNYAQVHSYVDIRKLDYSPIGFILHSSFIHPCKSKDIFAQREIVCLFFHFFIFLYPYFSWSFLEKWIILVYFASVTVKIL